MQLCLLCPACGALIVVHKGPLIDLPFGLALVELLVHSEDSHVCHRPKET